MDVNKSMSWHQQKKIIEGKTIKIYNKTRAGIG